MSNTIDTSVLIVGGGPAGLFLAICLRKKGIGCKILEKRAERIQHSRSLGIHPVSLELFEETGIVDAFLQAGLKIKKGIAHTGKKKLGEISFETCPKPYNYILSCPQYETERILEEALNEIDDEVLIRGAEFREFEETPEKIITHYSSVDGKLKSISSSLLIGCDGKNSAVRSSAGIAFVGGNYPDTYIMGDFSDTTGFGSDAVVFLPKQGLIECFPLPNGMRRWVVKTGEFIENPERRDIESRVLKRIDFDLSNAENVMLSGFGVQHYLAHKFTSGRVVLCGDAAHVVSPIGGQGMNLGWLDGWELAESLAEGLNHNKFSLEHIKTANHKYDIKQSGIAKKVIRRAELNMALGRKRTSPLLLLRNLAVRIMLNPPFSTSTAKLFTMRKLTNWLF